MSEECDEAELLRLLDDEYARGILTATSRQPMSATELSEACDASEPTIYRRVQDLKACDLLAERTAYDEDGHHYGVYVATVERATVEFDDGELRVTVDRRRPEAPADRLTELFENLRE